MFKFTALLVTSTRTSENTHPSSKYSVYLFGFQPGIMHLRKLSKMAARFNEPQRRERRQQTKIYSTDRTRRIRGARIIFGTRALNFSFAIRDTDCGTTPVLYLE